MQTLKDIATARRETLQEKVYQALKMSLISGELASGQQLTVREVAEAAGTSAMPAREAMRRLVAEKALEMLPNGTVRVSQVSNEQRAEAREIRMQLEGLAARWAASRITEPEVSKLHQLNQELLAALRRGDARSAVQLNQRFHFAVYKVASGGLLMDMIESLWAQNGPFVMAFTLNTYKSRGTKTAERSMRFHTKLIEALRRGDSDAAEKAIRADIGQSAVFSIASEARVSSRPDAQPTNAVAKRRRRVVQNMTGR